MTFLPCAREDESAGMSAVLLPFRSDGAVDWDALAAHVARTAEVGLVPAVNMDTGYVQELDAATRERVLDVARAHAGGEFVAGAQVADAAGDDFDPGRLRTGDGCHPVARRHPRDLPPPTG